MRIFFSAFPGGWPGITLLLMRIIVAASLLIQAVYYARQPEVTLMDWALGFAAILCAGLLVLGSLTPLVASAVILGALGIWFHLIPSSTPTLFNSKATDVFAITILAAIAAIGPGAISIDARLFGRREIVFPRQISSYKEHPDAA